MAESTKKFVVDASIVLSVLLPDEKVLAHYTKYLKLFQIGKIQFIAPEILKYEVANGLRSAFRQDRISKELVSELYASFQKMTFIFEQIDYIEVLKLSTNQDLTFYDAAYVYLVKSNKCRLLTLDTSL